MELILASRNKKKIREVEAILANHFPGIRILSLDDVGYIGDIEENGETYEENALTKARTAVEAGGNRYAAIADDSGLSVDALNGAPGVYSARYAGGHGDDAANNAKLLRELAARPNEPRTAAFVCAMACVFPDGASFTCEGRCPGEILTEARGEGGFGYDPVFFYPPMKKTFGQMSAEEKHAISHRGNALKAFQAEWEKYNAQQ